MVEASIEKVFQDFKRKGLTATNTVRRWSRSFAGTSSDMHHQTTEAGLKITEELT